MDFLPIDDSRHAFGLALSFRSGIPPSIADDFGAIFQESGTSLHIEETEDRGPYAGITWLFPTAVILWIGKAYFTSFLSEAGKTHFDLLSKGLLSLWERLLGPGKVIEIHVVTSTRSPAKAKRDPYSPALSVLYPLGSRKTLKFIFLEGVSRTAFAAAVRKINDLLVSLSSQPDAVTNLLEANRNLIVSGQLLMTYDEAMNELIVLNPVPSPPSKMPN
jgi:hypothetical protein